MVELAKLAIIITLLVFILPIMFLAVFWVLGTLASGNVIPFIIFLVICLWAIAGR